MKKKPKAKLSAKEKKERSMLADRVITTLPLEFRGSDPNLRRNMETVIEGMLNRQGRGVTRGWLLVFLSEYLTHVIPMNDSVVELIKQPDLPQARVNKCLIALVNRKVVRKDNSTVRILKVLSDSLLLSLVQFNRA